MTINATDSHTMSSPGRNLKKRGQVVAEYVMILTTVAVLLAAAKLKVNEDGSLDLSGRATDSKTIMESMSGAFSTWLRDIVIIISLPA